MAKLCPRGKAAAKRKFKVYPSAYANMYASAVCSGKVTPGGKKRAKKAEGGKADEAPLRERADYGQRSRQKVSTRKRAIQKRSGYKKGGKVEKKFNIKPVGGVKKGSTKPNKYVGVDTTSGYYGIKGDYKTKGGTKISGSVTKDFSKADVKYPGGSQTFKSKGKPYISIQVEKKFGGPKKKDLTKFINEDRVKKANGGIAKGCGKVMNNRRKKTKYI